MENRGRKALLICCAVLVLAVILAARPVYKLLRSHRAESLAKAAAQAIDRQAWTEASQKAQAAYHLDPNHPAAIRAVARLYTIAGQANALVFWENLRATGKATDEDRRELVRAGLQFGKAAEVENEAISLAEEIPPNVDNLKLAAQFFLMSRNVTNALRFSRQLAKAAPSDSSDVMLAQALLATRDPAELGNARSILQQVASGTNSAALDAQVLLAQSGMLPDEQMPGLIKNLSRNTNARLSHRLLAEELRLRLQPNERDATVTNLVAEFSNSALTNRLEVGRWLNRQREFARTLELLSAPDALKDRDAFLVRVDALAALGKWREARDELETPAAPIEPILRELYLARAAKELKLTPEADAHWRRVHLELSSKPEAMLYVAQYAEQIGELDEARKAYERLSAVPEFTDKGYAGMIRIAEELGGTRTLREIMRDLSARRPDDPAPENDFAYLNLLLGERVDTSKEIAQKLYDAQPNVMAFRNTLALAYLRLDKPAEAKKIYDGLNLDWRVLKPGWQAVHAAVVGANGETYLARTLARQIPLAALKPEEKALIQPWL